MSSPENMDRRQFLKGLAGAGVAGAMVGAPKAEAQATERERRESISPEAYK